LASEVQSLWLGEKAEKDPAAVLQEMGFSDGANALQRLSDFQGSQRYCNMSELGRKRLNDLMPSLLVNVGQTDDALITLERIITLLEAIVRRSAYMVLLYENPKALQQLVKLCAISPWIADQLVHYPLLLGELLDETRLYAPLDLVTLEKSLVQRVSAVLSKDLEGQMEALHRFKLVHIFRVAVMDVTDVLPIMRVSDHLTNIAIVILREVQDLALKPYLTNADANISQKDIDFITNILMPRIMIVEIRDIVIQCMFFVITRPPPVDRETKDHLADVQNVLASFNRLDLTDYYNLCNTEIANGAFWELLLETAQTPNPVSTSLCVFHKSVLQRLTEASQKNDPNAAAALATVFIDGLLDQEKDVHRSAYLFNHALLLGCKKTRDYLTQPSHDRPDGVNLENFATQAHKNSLLRAQLLQPLYHCRSGLLKRHFSLLPSPPERTHTRIHLEQRIALLHDAINEICTNGELTEDFLQNLEEQYPDIAKASKKIWNLILSTRDEFNDLNNHQPNLRPTYAFISI